jgi:selenocysteine-specific translation elongation factor
LPIDISTDKLKLVWFSQNIDINRGLECIIPVIKKYSHFVEFHLIGNLSQQFEDVIKNNKEVLIHHSPRSQFALHQKLAEFDIGIAPEDNKTDSNRNLCLTNKIISYYQAGLYILASDTIAQSEFLHSRTLHGKCFKNALEFEVELKSLFENLVSVRKEKKSRFELASKENWKNESTKLTSTWSKLLN